MKTYSLDAINKVENDNTYFDFPVLYPNKDYFANLQMVLNSNGIILELLAENNYKIEDFINDLSNNIELNAFAKENDFKVTILEKEDNKGVLSERLINSDNQVIMELYYSNTVFQVEDLINSTTYETTIYLDFDILKIYFIGGYLYLEDKTTNKKYFVYLD